MTKIINGIIVMLMVLLIIIASHMDFLTEVQKGNAVDSHGRTITMQDATWFTDCF